MTLLPRRREDRDSSLAPLATLQSEMNRLFSSFFDCPFGGLWGDGRGFTPPVDVRETEDKVIVEAELPGMDPKDVQIRVEGDSLIISGERRQEKEEKTGSFHRVERSYGSFLREVPLPYGADPNRCDATYKNGVLMIELAKKEEAKPKTIQVKVK